MKVFTYSQARQNLSKLLILAQSEDIEIRRKDGSVFVLRAKTVQPTSPFDVPAVEAEATTDDILEAVHTSRER